MLTLLRVRLKLKEQVRHFRSAREMAKLEHIRCEQGVKMRTPLSIDEVSLLRADFKSAVGPVPEGVGGSSVKSSHVREEATYPPSLLGGVAR